MSEYVKWEPVVGQVPPDGCEFIMNKYANDVTWLVWAASGNRAINENDQRMFQFRIPAPAPIKYFTFEERPEAAKEYKTLADVPEGVRCVVTGNYSSIQMIRLCKGGGGVNTEGGHIDHANQYHTIQILDPLPAPQLPATMAEAEEYRVYKTKAYGPMFKASGAAWCRGYNGFMQPYAGDGGWDVGITAATNTYAVPCSQEVK